jgi:hypothetical protein
MRGISESVVARVAAGPTRAPIPVRAGVSRWNVRIRICNAIVAGATALSLAASALATAEPAAAQWSGGGHGGTPAQGVPIIIGPRQPESLSSGWGANAPDWSDDPCWQVRPIYSVTGAWLDNQRVNVCH